MLCVVDDFARECLAAVVDTSLGGMRVVRELESVVNQRGWPHTIVSDNGTEPTSNAVLRWTAERVVWHYIQPGQPVRNAFIESFNSKLRDQCRNEHFFCGLAGARHGSKPGRRITTSSGLTAGWVLWPQPNTPTGKGAVRLSKLRAPRPAPLLHRPTWGRTSSPDSTHGRAYVGVRTTRKFLVFDAPKQARRRPIC